MWEVEKRGSVNEEENKSNMIVIFFSCEITKHHFLAKQKCSKPLRFGAFCVYGLKV